MAKREIILVPNKILKKISQPQRLGKPAIQLIKNLADTLLPQEGARGVGLAAPQIGINKRVFIINLEYPSARTKRYPENGEKELNLKYEIRAFINPEIIFKSKETNWDVLNPENKYFEGCLSIPEVFGYVERPWKIKVKYTTLDKKHGFVERIDEFEGFNSIYIQHEQDHLDGIVFTEKVLEQGEKLYEPTEEGFQELTI